MKINSDLIRVYKSVHTWTGILSGLALFIAFYAGALTVFKSSITAWATPPAQTTETINQVASSELIQQTLALHPEAAKGFELHLQQNEQHPAPLTWRVKDSEEEGHDTLAGEFFQSTFNPQGEIEIGHNQISPAAEIIDILHSVIGLPVDSDGNRWIMGVIAMLYGIALISGLIILLPSLVKDLFAFRVGKNLKRQWLDAHNIVGLFSLPFHFVFAITAVVFAFHDPVYGLQNLAVHDGKLMQVFIESAGFEKDGETHDPSSLMPPYKLVEKAEELSTDFVPTLMQYSDVDSDEAVVRVWGYDENAIMPRTYGGFVALDPYTGRVMNSEYLPGKQTTSHTILSGMFALHFATFGGSGLGWGYFILGLAGAWLFYSGNLLWIESRRRKLRRDDDSSEQRKDVRMMGSATIGISLGCVAGISLMLVASKWFYTPESQLTSTLFQVYYLTFFACIGWAFIRGAAKAAVELLWFSAIATFAIPATSILAWALPNSGLWGHTSIAAISVDLVALLGGLSLTWIARSTASRIQHGPADSLWSAVEFQKPATAQLTR